MSTMYGEWHPARLVDDELAAELLDLGLVEDDLDYELLGYLVASIPPVILYKVAHIWDTLAAGNEQLLHLDAIADRLRQFAIAAELTATANGEHENAAAYAAARRQYDVPMLDEAERVRFLVWHGCEGSQNR